MPVPKHCPNPSCSNFSFPHRGWYYRSGTYQTACHGSVTRYRCKQCGKSLSDQTFSLFYYTKRRVDLRRVFTRLRGGGSLRDIAREHGVSRTAIQTAVFRLGRQAMAAHSLLTQGWQVPEDLAFDGLVSFVTSQDFPTHLSVGVESQAEFILSMTHAVVRRGGRLTPGQQRRRNAKEAVWKPPIGSLKRAISLLVEELAHYCQSGIGRERIFYTDELPFYPVALSGDSACRFFFAHHLLTHRSISSKAPRTVDNPLFPVNYVDMLLRHRLKEHTRETIAFGRHAVHQMHRAWIFAYDHNYLQPRRVKEGDSSTVRASLVGINEGLRRRIGRKFFSERLDLRGCALPESCSTVWRGELTSPPVRWKSGQREARKVAIPKFALRDLLLFQQFQ